MSFGVSVGDILAVSKLALDVWGRFQDSSDQFKAIRIEFRSLYLVLDDAAQSLPELELSQEQNDRLNELTHGSKEVLDDLSAFITDHESLGVEQSNLKVKTRKTWKKLTFDEQTIRDLRHRIISNTALLNAFIAGLASKAAKSTNDKITVLDERVQGLHSYNYDQERSKILKWVSAMNFSAQQSAILDQREEGTGSWLLASRDFQEWMDNSPATLLCIGMPGPGKTMLASIAIEHLISTICSQQDVGIAYIFCDYKTQDEQTSLNLIASLLKQLLQHQCSIPEDIRRMYEHHYRDGTRPGLDEAFKSLRSVVASFSRVYFVVDALDELQQGGKLIQTLLSKLSELQAMKPVNLMLTSRDIPHVTEKFQCNVRLEVRARDEDVEKYVDGHIDELPKLVSRSPKLQQSIKDAIVSAVDGMFLLARLHLESLMDKMSATDVQEALESLSKGAKALSIAYDQAMRRIEAQRPGMRLLAQKAMCWITYAKRLLSVVELRYALGVQHGTSEFNEDSLYDIDDIISACGGLVVVDQSQYTATVRLVHYSTQEFLKQAGETYFPYSHHDIASTCLTYLLYDTSKEGVQWIPTPEERFRVAKPKYDSRDLVQRYPLIVYAAQYWASHACNCSDLSVRNLLMQFLRDEYKVSCATEVIVLQTFLTRNWRHEEDKLLDAFRLPTCNPVSGMHLATYYGIRGLVSMLLDSGFAADVRDASNRSPLFWAALKGHTAVVELLLSLNETEAVPKSQNDRTSLTSAVSRDQNEGVQSDQASLVSRTPEYERLAVLQESLNLTTVDVNCQDSYGNTPLIVAAEYGHDRVVVQLLKSLNTSVNLANEGGLSPLFAAAGSGHEAVVRLLLGRSDIDINVKYRSFAPLAVATLRRYEVVVQILLSHVDIDVNVRSRSDCTPLMLAAWRYYENVSKILVSHHQIDVNCKDNDGETALYKAAFWCREAIVQCLLRYTGIDSNTKANNGHTPLSKATYGWFDESRANERPLWNVHFAEREAIVKLLLMHPDIDIDCIDEEGNNLLSRVTKRAREIPEPRLDGVIALLRTAMEGRFGVACED